MTDLDGYDQPRFIEFFLENRDQIEARLRESGAVKIRGIRIPTLEVFQEIVESISCKFLNYIDGNSPRTKLSGSVYTSTEYDKSQRITMHNELSYSAKWPNRLFFSCLQEADTGGETLLADSRAILAAMNSEIVAEIMEKGIVYTRNLHAGKGLGPSWQHTFETQDKKQVEDYCAAYGMRYEWGRSDTLKLRHPGRGVIGHRETGERVWFNQIDQFHPCQLGDEVYEAMMTIYDDPEDFPMYVSFGDGKKITEGMVHEILRTIGALTVAPVWRKNELLILDNELVCHGRNPFTGNRKVLVAMSE